MVKIVDFKLIQTEDKKNFCQLIVQGGLEPVQNKTTGRIYFTMRRASVTTTFDAEACMSLVGSELPGTIYKVPCEPYDYTVKESGEVISLDYNWQYIDEDLVNAQEQIIDKKLVK